MPTTARFCSSRTRILPAFPTAPTGQPVGETLENLQFTYNYNDGINTNQLAVPSGLSESQIRSVNVYLGVRSVDIWGQNHKYMRNNFQTQVSLRSMAYVNRYR